MPNSKSPIQQAELLLHLYELRRETVMRQARSYVGGAQFNPQSAAEFIDSIRKGDQQTSYILQVFGYWDMVCAFVLHGALTEGLVRDTCQEMYFQFEKVQPYIAGFRQKMNLPEFLKSMETVYLAVQERKNRTVAKPKKVRTPAPEPETPAAATAEA